MKIYIPEQVPSMNKGEEAILRGILEGLKEQGINVELTVFSYVPEIDQVRFKDFKVVDGITFRPAGGGKIKRLAEAINIWARHLLFLITWKLLGKRSFFIFRDDVWRAYGEADLILVGHDGVFSDVNLLFAIFAKLLGKKHAIFGMGFSGFRSFWGRKLARFIMPLFDLIVLREERTLRHFESVGVPLNKMFLKPDPAFSLKPSDQMKFEEVLSKEGLNSNERPLIGMVAVKGSIIFDRCFEKIKDRNGKYSKHVEFLALLIENIIEITSGRIVFLPHCIGPTLERDDRIIAKDIKTKVKEKYKEDVSLIENEYNASILKGFIKNLDFLIAERTHALIGAASVGTPFLAITVTEDERTHDIVGKTIGMKELIVDINDPDLDGITKLLKEKWEARDAIKGKLFKRSELIHKECREASRLLGSLLKNC